jgi:GT2 family glycosyltransferase
MGLVVAVIVNWNNTRDTLRALASIDAMDEPRPVAIVVDNASSDGSAAALRQARSRLTLIESMTNGGYAGGNNLGIEAALELGAEFVWVLNNDARPRPDALRRALAVFAGDEALGIVSTNVSPQTFAPATIDGAPIICGGCESERHAAAMLLGPSLIFRSRVFADVGLFDERYFHYREEEDLVNRVSRAGWRLSLACRAWVDHGEGATLPKWSPQARYYMVRNAILYEKWNHPRRLGTLRTLIAHRRMLRASLALGTLRNRDARRLRAVGLGIADGIRERSGQRDLGPSYWHH